MPKEVLKEMTELQITKLTYGLHDVLANTVVALTSLPWYLKFFPLILVYFAPLKDSIHLLIAIVFADIFFSLLRQYRSVTIARMRNLKKRKLTPSENMLIFDRVFDGRRLFDSVIKLLAYIILMMLFYSVDAVLFKIPLNEISTWRFTLTNGVSLIIVMSEFKSILRHLGEITHNSVFSRIGDFAEKKVSSYTETQDVEQPIDEEP